MFGFCTKRAAPRNRGELANTFRPSADVIIPGSACLEHRASAALRPLSCASNANECRWSFHARDALQTAPIPPIFRFSRTSSPRHCTRALQASHFSCCPPRKRSHTWRVRQERMSEEAGEAGLKRPADVLTEEESLDGNDSLEEPEHDAKARKSGMRKRRCSSSHVRQIKFDHLRLLFETPMPEAAKSLNVSVAKNCWFAGTPALTAAAGCWESGEPGNAAQDLPQGEDPRVALQAGVDTVQAGICAKSVSSHG